MNLATDKKISIPPGYQKYRYNIKYLLNYYYSDDKRRGVVEHLCGLLGIGKDMLNKYMGDTLEKKRYNLNPDKLKILSTFFSVSIDDLINQ